jgi:hypothetical protein
MLPEIDTSEPEDYDKSELGNKISNKNPFSNSKTIKKQNGTNQNIFGKQLIRGVKNVVVNSALHALGVDTHGSHDGSHLVRKNQNHLLQQSQSDGTFKLATQLAQSLAPLNVIAARLARIAKTVEAIAVDLHSRPSSKFPSVQSNGISPFTSGITGYIQRSTIPFMGGNEKVASVNGESPTSAYRENERKEKDGPDQVEVNEFSENALKQLGDLIAKATEKLGSRNNALADMAAGAGLSSMFRKKKPASKSSVGEDEEIRKSKFPSDKVERAKIQPRNAAGRFAKAIPEAEEGLAKTGGTLARVLGKSSGLLKIGGKALGAAALPIMAGLEYADRTVNKKQTQKQAILGTAGSTAGALAGGVAGAEGGAVIGGGIGALFGGVGAVPGAAVGSVVGGLGGAIAGSGVGGWLADKFTGVGKIAKKQLAPTTQTKDMMALQKTKEKKAKEESGNKNVAPTVISAPSTSTTIVQQSQNTLSGGGGSGGTKGPRGSLDLSKY